MSKRLRFKNSDGFTLIEIIASIAILGMVIAIFLPIFPQIFNWTDRAEDELIASNLLSQIAYEVRYEESTNMQLLDNIQTAKPISDCIGAYSKLDNIDIPDEIMYDITYSACQSDQEKNANLIRIKISISDNERTISESFTYIGDKNVQP